MKCWIYMDYWNGNSVFNLGNWAIRTEGGSADKWFKYRSVEWNRLLSRYVKMWWFQQCWQ